MSKAKKALPVVIALVVVALAAVVGYVRMATGPSPVASGRSTRDMGVSIYSASRGRRVYFVPYESPTAAPYGSPITDASLMPDGTTVAIGEAGKLTLWKIRPIKMVKELVLPGIAGYRLECSPNGRAVAVSAINSLYQGYLGLWRLSDDKYVKLSGKGSGPAAFSPDSELLACQRADGKGEVFRVRDGKALAKLYGDHPVWSPDGRLLATAAGCPPNESMQAIIWRVSDWKPLHKISIGVGRPVSLVFTPDGKTLICAGDGAVKGWNVETAKHLFTLAGGELAAVSEKGDLLATLGPRDKNSPNTPPKTIRVWRMADKKLAAEWRFDKEEWAYPEEMVFLGETRLVTSVKIGRNDRTVSVWSVPGGRRIVRLRMSRLAGTSRGADLFAVTSSDVPGED